MMKYLAPLFLILSAPVLAEPEPDKVPDLGLMQVAMPLLLVIILIFVLAWLARKLNTGAPVLGQGIRVIASAPLSGQSRVCLVRVGDKDFLLGVTSQQVTRLHVFDETIEMQDASASTVDLARQFKKLLKGGDRDQTG